MVTGLLVMAAGISIGNGWLIAAGVWLVVTWPVRLVVNLARLKDK